MAQSFFGFPRPNTSLCPVHSRSHVLPVHHYLYPPYYEEYNIPWYYYGASSNFTERHQPQYVMHRPLLYYHHHIPPQRPNFCPPTRSHCPSFPPPANPFLNKPILRPPMYCKDYSIKCNLPSPPSHLIFEPCKHLPPWWTNVKEAPIAVDEKFEETVTCSTTAGKVLTLPEILEVYNFETEITPISFRSYSEIASICHEDPQVSIPAVPKEPPSYPLTALAAMAILSSPYKMATLSEIYAFISSTFPYYEKTKRAWKNSVRNCLTNSECFQQAPSLSSAEDKNKKIVYWMINPSTKNSYMKGSFARKRKPKNVENKPILCELNSNVQQRTIPNSTTLITEMCPVRIKKPRRLICYIEPEDCLQDSNYTQ